MNTKNVNAETIQTEENSQPSQPDVVSREMYDKLYNQALALEKRYTRLFELYNSLIEAYLTRN
jgi:hypothetical protein